MTSAELESIRQSIPLVTSLFASGTEQTGPQWNDPSDNYAGSRFINWSEGIPPDYAMPYANGGKKVLRKDLNAIGNIASRELYLLQHGGYHTFNQEVAKAIGGYPYGAFLDWYQPSTGWLRKVRCVKEGGNCFTPIDDPDHGVGSGEPHWEIADMFDEDRGADGDIVNTRAVEQPNNEKGAWFGGFCLEIQPCTLAPNQTVKSEPWKAPYDAMVSFPIIRSGWSWFHQATRCVCPYGYVSLVGGSSEGQVQLASVESFIEVTDAEGNALEIPIDMNPEFCFTTSFPLFSYVEDYGDIITDLYRLIPRMFLNKGNSMRFCVRNGISGQTVQTSFCSAKFDLREVV